MTIEEILFKIASQKPDDQLDATQATRKMLSRERNPPIDAIIQAGVVRPLVEFLRRADKLVYPLPKDYCITGRANVIFCAVGLR